MPPDPRSDPTAAGPDELRAARAEQRAVLVLIGAFSVFVNLLLLTGPVFMLQIYDRVLASRSEATLVALLALVVFLYAIYAVLDHVRARLAARVSARFQTRLERRVFAAALRRRADAPADAEGQRAQGDLDAVQRFLASPVFLALYDVPWTPLFILVIALFHPMLGLLALGGAAVLVVVTWLNQTLTRGQLSQAHARQLAAHRYGEQLQREAEILRGLGMQQAGFGRWQRARQAALGSMMAASDRGGLFATLSRSFRLFLQSAMLGLGAWLVLQGQLTPGAMIAASIILGRALAPLEQTVNQWDTVQRARDGWAGLAALLAAAPPEAARTRLPRPKGQLDVQGLSVAPPGTRTLTLRGVSFALAPGQALGVIGPSGAGKTSLARAVIGAWRPVSGRVLLDGAPVDHYDPEQLGRSIGYLPQKLTLFDGTIAENIARLDPAPDDDEVILAARRAGAHQMILDLPQGYDTPVSGLDTRLSGGQIQRLGLARALYGTPALVLLDEPNSNLDADGSNALNAAIRGLKSIGATVIIMAHRPAAIQECDLLLMLDGGQQRAFGPRDEVLRNVARNHTDIVGGTQATAAATRGPGT